ncbi:MAG: ribosome assembly factor SBDS, partial [Candidatus Thermoplasmatota archaeon]|nr:ribosome assembly factor SBDS [Candidatus Thermoplasmatota archaeon]
DAVIARLESGGHRFEILIDPNEAQSYKEGDEIDWEDSIAVDGVWADSAKGERSPENILDEFFGSSDLIEIYKKILTEGTIQLTSEQKKEMIDNKRKQILSHIVANAMNPQTGGAHPPQRIENAIVEAKYNFDPVRSVEKQVEDIVRKIRPLIPISFEKVKAAVKIPAIHVGKCYGQISGLGTIENEEYQSDGSWIGIVKMSAASYNELENLLGAVTKGSAELKII